MKNIETEEALMFTYKPLLKLMIDRDVKKKELRDKLNMSPATVAKISKNDYIALEVIDRICNFFQVQPNEIMEHIPDVFDVVSSSPDDLESDQGDKSPDKFQDDLTQTTGDHDLQTVPGKMALSLTACPKGG
jgi:putative transcriptional regulator